MITSMTGYASLRKNLRCRRGLLEFSLEIRTVNSKFFDLNLRIPKTYQGFESLISGILRAKIRRGRVDFNLSVRVLKGSTQEIQLNDIQLKSLAKVLRRANSVAGIQSDLRLSDLLEFPDWLEPHDILPDRRVEGAFLEKMVTTAADNLVKARRHEGKMIEKALLRQVDRYQTGYEKFATAMDSLLAAYRKRLRERIQSLQLSQKLDPDRLEQEVAIQVTRGDFQEEVDRIEHHVKTFRKTVSLTSAEEKGRALEFIVQELQRETNTLGSKNPDAALTPVLVDMKTCIERIREQLQNVE